MNETAISVSAPLPVNIRLNAAKATNIEIGANSVGGTRNYNLLANKPRINGVELSGNQTLADLNVVSENTQEGWESDPLYVPKSGEICFYSDSGKIKIGDGSVPIVDLPFIGDQDNARVLAALQEHVQDSVAHVTQEDRNRWDAKLNYSISDEELILTRG